MNDYQYNMCLKIDEDDKSEKRIPFQYQKQDEKGNNKIFFENTHIPEEMEVSDFNKKIALLLNN